MNLILEILVSFFWTSSVIRAIFFAKRAIFWDFFLYRSIKIWIDVFLVIDPTKATVGVGLGLPGYTPGAADRNLINEAIQKSEVQLIEDAMLSDKIKMTDYERTEQEISDQVSFDAYSLFFLHSFRLKFVE